MAGNEVNWIMSINRLELFIFILIYMACATANGDDSIAQCDYTIRTFYSGKSLLKDLGEFQELDAKLRPVLADSINQWIKRREILGDTVYHIIGFTTCSENNIHLVRAYEFEASDEIILLQYYHMPIYIPMFVGYNRANDHWFPLMDTAGDLIEKNLNLMMEEDADFRNMQSFCKSALIASLKNPHQYLKTIIISQPIEIIAAKELNAYIKSISPDFLNLDDLYINIMSDNPAIQEFINLAHLDEREWPDTCRDGLRLSIPPKIIEGVSVDTVQMATYSFGNIVQEWEFLFSKDGKILSANTKSGFYEDISYVNFVPRGECGYMGITGGWDIEWHGKELIEEYNQLKNRLAVLANGWVQESIERGDCMVTPCDRTYYGDDMILMAAYWFANDADFVLLKYRDEEWQLPRLYVGYHKPSQKWFPLVDTTGKEIVANLNKLTSISDDLQSMPILCKSALILALQCGYKDLMVLNSVLDPAVHACINLSQLEPAEYILSEEELYFFDLSNDSVLLRYCDDEVYAFETELYNQYKDSLSFIPPQVIYGETEDTVRMAVCCLYGGCLAEWELIFSKEGMIKSMECVNRPSRSYDGR
jgi:hypothetical protein